MAGRRFPWASQRGTAEEQKSDPTPSSGTNPGEDDPKAPIGVWVAIGAAVAVTLALFTSLGIEEEFLRRMVRNAPWRTALSIGLVIVGASLAASSALLALKKSSQTPRQTRRLEKYASRMAVTSACFVTAGTIIALLTGVDSLHSRDMPGLSMSAVKSSSGDVSISAEATAKSLRSSEKILLRFYGVESDLPADSDVDKLCLGGGWPDMTDPSGSSVMWWGESGPDQTGAASVSEGLVIAGDRFSLVCAYAAIVNPQDVSSEEDPPPPGEGKKDRFFAWSLVDLRNLTSAPTASPTPTSSPPAATQ